IPDGLLCLVLLPTMVCAVLILALRFNARNARKGRSMNRNEKLLWAGSFVVAFVGIFLALAALKVIPQSSAPSPNETSEYIGAASTIPVTFVVLYISKYDRHGRKGLLRFSKL